MTIKVKGYCPMGCGDTLFLGHEGYIICGFLDCPKPEAADEVLHISETSHVAYLDEYNYTLVHPLKCRLFYPTLKCPEDTYLNSLTGPPRKPGKYRFKLEDDKARFIPEVSETKQ